MTRRAVLDNGISSNKFLDMFIHWLLIHMDGSSKAETEGLSQRKGYLSYIPYYCSWTISVTVKMTSLCCGVAFACCFEVSRILGDGLLNLKMVVFK